MSLFVWSIVGLLLGARLFYTLIFDTSGKFRSAPWFIFWPFNEKCEFVGLSGMNYYGGVIGALIGGLIFMWRRKIDMLDWGDMIAAGIPLGYTFGRLGNFINGELFGRVTTAPWGVVFPLAGNKFDTSLPWVHEMASKVGMATDSAYINLPRHPVQIYEAFFEGVFLWLILWFICRRFKPFKGFVLSLYILGYGLIRFILDYIRMPIGEGFMIQLVEQPYPVDVFYSPFNFILSQLFSFFMIAGGIAMLIVFYIRSKEVPPEEGKKPSLRKLRKKIKITDM
jgi:phosphatidylglycerol:prolipoprotein diacylglycerol transferase